MWRPYVIVFLVVSGFRIVSGTAIQQNFGKVNITESSSDGFYCGQVSFTTPFQGSGPIRVFASLSLDNRPNIANEASVVMVDSVDQNSFTACVMEPGQPSGERSLNWFAFSDNALPQGTQAGTVSYNTFTSGTSCRVVAFGSPFSSPPKVFLSVRHSASTGRKDAMASWTEGVGPTHFRICLREMTTFSGVHDNLHVEWVALANTFSANMTDLSSVVFPNSGQPVLGNNYAYCQVENFTRRFHEPPTVILNPRRTQDPASSLSDQSIVTWVKNVDRTSFEVCLKDLPGINGRHEPLTVDYSALGDHDPCLDVTCDNFAVCRAFGPYDARCLCVVDCPSVEQNVCASNGQSFDNICLFQLEVCKTAANYTYYHHGSCRGFPMTRGRRNIREVPGWSESHCQAVRFEPLTFYPDKPVHVQLSVSHVNDTSQVHDAAVSWVENVTDSGFTFCVMESGRNEGPPHGFATVEWMAYQGAPQGGVAGVVSIAEWWTGTKCQNVPIPAQNGTNPFQSTPTVLMTAEHHRRSLKHDAASLWLEDVRSTSFRVCLRELQNFDGAHQDIRVNWLAFVDLERPLFTEHNSVNFFTTTQNPSVNTNYARCQQISLSASYLSPPTVLVSPYHSSSGGNLDPNYYGVTAWIESITRSGFKMCFKEISVNNRYDPVTVNYVVLRDICQKGWVYYRGFCYERMDSCQTWTNASSACMAASSNLVGIESAEEDVFVQHLHRGKPSWIGLNDQANEGVYLWTDGGPVAYTNWGPGISTPPTNDNADCVRSVGKHKKYHWKATLCAECHNFTCKTDFDECGQNTDSCDPNADCTNTVGSYTCQCRSGYTGDGNTCTDIDECAQNTDSCDPNASCTNTRGSYNCQCRAGYTGDGKTCTDIDECTQNTDSCDSNANCTNTAGSYTCQCRAGYTGDGKNCTAYCGDPGSPTRGYTRGSSFTFGSKVTFHCSYSGEALTGATSATCQADSTWTNAPLRCKNHNVRLRGSGYSNRGRVELYRPGYGWYTLCDHSWDINDGHVLCRQLGYSGATAVRRNAYYGRGSTSYITDIHPSCSGSETALWNCPLSYSMWRQNCGHSDDVSVDCY